MKRLLPRLAVVLLLAAAKLVVNPDAPMNPSGFAIKRGINISHWLSQDFGFCSGTVSRPSMALPTRS